ncbi:protein arginine N-methyltransferase PRMT10-like [Amaranthus tricolor]|uniref:protein arginine N-methyltransferase PRMT10-like n=1 Tax=Amaranthus tricolor TaxID=29722 RepID=UPI00258836FD|nr:protein arginine N-methyltransferase PRMT10-like [Amaranthus tricolor]
MYEHACLLVKANGLEGIVEVIEGSMEDVTLPEKVDVIISEWMGYFLLRESMSDSVICARDRWLKPTGVMQVINAFNFHWSLKNIKSTFLVYVIPILRATLNVGFAPRRCTTYECGVPCAKWFTLPPILSVNLTLSAFMSPEIIIGSDFRLIINEFKEEFIGTAAIVKEIDCLMSTERRESPATSEIELTTAPSVQNGTHWGDRPALVVLKISLVAQGSGKLE